MRRLRNHDTGFPEPFNGASNTTLPHPEANLSPDAFLTQDDVTFTRKANTRRSFRHKNKRTISHGRITPQMEAMYGDVLIEEDESILESPLEGTESFTSRRSSSIHPLGPPAIVLTNSRPTTAKDGDSVFSSSAGERSPTSSERSSKRGLFSRLRFLK